MQVLRRHWSWSAQLTYSLSRTPPLFPYLLPRLPHQELWLFLLQVLSKFVDSNETQNRYKPFISGPAAEINYLKRFDFGTWCSKQFSFAGSTIWLSLSNLKAKQKLVCSKLYLDKTLAFGGREKDPWPFPLQPSTHSGCRLKGLSWIIGRFS